ncbi:hypothetical protein PROFUN_08680 [Planoprotostelium fungivorum]|uniref:Bulb-type lectin domain-containing protein n=1 Tax=Planoprotostelium fungivorum TaxID=1890364 RepID=A0A2P6MQV5_9EUKA|nr:hypothetical protein PROFUN_08680 [Planoprotostelium fungivorum]
MRTLVLLLVVTSVLSHCTFWHPSTFDCDRANGNSDNLAQPLQDYTFDQWWWHGNLKCPPADGVVFNLPANGEAVVELSSNKAFTSDYCGGYRGMNFPNTPEPWAGNELSNIHAVNREDVAGCAFAIAYKSDPYQVQPSDFVVFSVVHDCIARQNQSFSIPNLPACPNGKCMCSWFWIHKSIGGTDQMYMTPFVCNVTNAKSDAAAVDVANAQPPRKCYDPSSCTMGPRNPMYWKNERPNMPEEGHRAPTYSTVYGWREGAQKDIFVNTNPYTYASKSTPVERKCIDAKLNTEGYGSRIRSDNTSTFLVDGGAAIVSPNCQYICYVEANSGSIMVVNQTDGNALWYGSAQTRGLSPYTLKVLPDGQVNNYDKSGNIQWSTPMTQGVGVGPYRLDITDGGQLVLSDALGRNRWENYFFDDRENKFLSTSPDPAVWGNGDATIHTVGHSDASIIIAGWAMVLIALSFF